jgi:hypothetical protein
MGMQSIPIAAHCWKPSLVSAVSNGGFEWMARSREFEIKNFYLLILNKRWKLELIKRSQLIRKAQD